MHVILDQTKKEQIEKSKNDFLDLVKKNKKDSNPKEPSDLSNFQKEEKREYPSYFTEKDISEFTPKEPHEMNFPQGIDSNKSAFSKLINYDQVLAPRKYSELVTYELSENEIKDSVSFAFHLEIKRLKFNSEIERIKDESTLALLDCFGISFSYSFDKNCNRYTNFNLEKLALSKSLKKTFGVPTYQTINMIQMSQIPQKDSNHKDIFKIKMSPLKDVTSIDVKFSFDYDIVLNIDLNFIKQISNLFSMKESHIEPQKEVKKNNFVLKFSSKKIDFTLGVPSLKGFGNLHFSFKNLIFVFNPEPLKIYFNLTSITINDKQTFKIQLESKVVKNQQPKVFCFSLYSPKLTKNSSVPDPNDLNKMFSTKEKEEDDEEVKKYDEKLIMTEIDYNGVAYVFGNEIENFKLKKSDKIEEYKQDADYFIGKNFFVFYFIFFLI